MNSVEHYDTEWWNLGDICGERDLAGVEIEVAVVCCGKAMIIFKVMAKTAVQCSSTMRQQLQHFSPGSRGSRVAIVKVVLLASVLVTVASSGGASPGHCWGGVAVFPAPLITQPAVEWRQEPAVPSALIGVYAEPPADTSDRASTYK